MDTSNLNVPPKLASSQYLVDLSALTSTDLTGPPMTPSTLGIAPVYHVYVFTCCSPTFCTAPLIGPTFDPMHDLRLSTTSLTSPSRTLDDVLSLYKIISPILAILLILAFVFALAAPSVMMLDRRVGSAGWVALLMHAVAALCLAVACVAGQVGAARLTDGLNGEFGPVGMRASSGPLLAPAWAALPLCVLNTGLAFVVIKKRKVANEDEKAAAAAAAAAAATDDDAAGAVQERDIPPSSPMGRPPSGHGIVKDRAMEPPQHKRVSSRPVSGASGRLTLENTVGEDMRDGWLRDSVLGSESSARFTGDGYRISGRTLVGDADAWYVAHGQYRQPVRMPEYQH